VQRKDPVKLVSVDSTHSQTTASDVKQDSQTQPKVCSVEVNLKTAEEGKHQMISQLVKTTETNCDKMSESRSQLATASHQTVVVPVELITNVDDKPTSINSLEAVSLEAGKQTAMMSPQTDKTHDKQQTVESSISPSSSKHVQLTTDGAQVDSVKDSSSDCTKYSVPPNCAIVDVDNSYSGSTSPHDVCQDYDSDLDEADSYVLDCIREFKEKQPGDGPAYLYVFTDQSQQRSCKQRFKVGTSRFPHKRLQQGKLFNPDLTSLSHVFVTSRQQATELIGRRLKAEKINDTLDWFLCSDDVITDVISDVVKKVNNGK
jgi:hypothetical protein